VGRVLKVADLVDDDPAKRDRVSATLKDTAQKNNRDYVDIIIALGMAKEGFDWIWYEHALTVGYLSILTEIVQIIGRATRDAPGKTRARLTNLIAEPDASEEAVTEAVNDTFRSEPSHGASARAPLRAQAEESDKWCGGRLRLWGRRLRS
jgi:superfamily II DNA or RNA helicase